MLYIFLLVLLFGIYAIYISKNPPKQKQNNFKQENFSFKKSYITKKTKRADRIKIHPQFSHLGINTLEDLKKVYEQ